MGAAGHALSGPRTREGTAPQGAVFDPGFISGAHGR